MERNRGINTRTLGEMFNCGKTNSEGIRSPFYFCMNSSGSRVHTSKAPHTSEYAKALYDWYVLATSKNIFLMGPQLVEKASKLLNNLESIILKGQMSG